jgi:Protein of unknown function (DUF3108)
MRNAILCCALLLSLGSSLAAPDKPFPSRVEVKYRVSIAGFPVGEGVEVFEQDRKSYSVVSETNTVGVAALFKLSIRREAKGSVTSRGLRSGSFVETRNGQFKRSASFDWAAGRVELLDGDKKQTLQLPPDTWDAASFAWNLAFSRVDMKDLQVHLTDGRQITLYKYAFLGREKLATPLGELDTMHVRKVLEDGDKREFDVWLAIDQHLLPARVRLTEKDGTAFDSVVESVNLTP